MSRRETIEQEIEHINQEILQVIRNQPNEGYELWCWINSYNSKIYSSRRLYVAALKEQIKRLKTELPKNPGWI